MSKKIHHFIPLSPGNIVGPGAKIFWRGCDGQNFRRFEFQKPLEVKSPEEFFIRVEGCPSKWAFTQWDFIVSITNEVQPVSWEIAQVMRSMFWRCHDLVQDSPHRHVLVGNLMQKMATAAIDVSKAGTDEWNTWRQEIFEVYLDCLRTRHAETKDLGF